MSADTALDRPHDPLPGRFVRAQICPFVGLIRIHVRIARGNVLVEEPGVGDAVHPARGRRDVVLVVLRVHHAQPAEERDVWVEEQVVRVLDLLRVPADRRLGEVGVEAPEGRIEHELGGECGGMRVEQREVA